MSWTPYYRGTGVPRWTARSCRSCRRRPVARPHPAAGADSAKDPAITYRPIPASSTR
ncbi:hypothetical protein SAZ11_07365 [Streptomyces sp. FXJ1.4098]|nr:hypothetical protein [Streptomyces sp. FXJ1.4098]